MTVQLTAKQLADKLKAEAKFAKRNATRSLAERKAASKAALDGNSKHARAEQAVQSLVKEAVTAGGTEARKAIKKRMTHTYKSQTIQSNDWSDKASQRTAGNVIEGVKQRGEKSCRKSSKCDIKINSYFNAKSRTPKGI